MNYCAKWIWIKKDYCTKTEMILFRKEFSVQIIPDVCNIDISADSKYIVYINGELVSRGPCKSDAYRKYYYTVDISRYLKLGSNVISAQVIHYAYDELKTNDFLTGPTSIISATHGGFIIMEHDTHLGLSTDNSYKCEVADYYKFINAKYTRYLGFYELTDSREYLKGWQSEGFQGDNWQNCEELSDSNNFISVFGHANIWSLVQSTIPSPFEERVEFRNITRFSGLSMEKWQGLLDEKEVEIASNSNVWFEIDAGEYLTAFPNITLEGGLDAKIRILYSECYEVLKNENEYDKRIRDNYETGNVLLFGEEDSFICSNGKNTFMPFHYRAFRFLRISIETKNEALKILSIHAVKTGYPLDVTGSFTGDETLNKLWDISVRTLKCCMYDTYMDCPFYEQMQYLMDSMLEMIFTYQISSDDRLARKAIYDFHCSQLPNGIIPCNAPSKTIQVIPGFGFYWIFMLSHHYQYFGDIDFIKEFFGTIDNLFSYFKNHIDKKDGLLKKTSYWEFVDWVKEWENGVPLENADDINIVYNMMMATALKEAANLNKAAGRNDTAREYNDLAKSLNEAVKKAAFDDSDGLFYDVPGKAQKSQHAQIWAVLSGIVEGNEAKELMLKGTKREDLCKCSYCMSFFLFRALEMVGLYSETENLWHTWTKLLDYNITTWPEDPVNQRSDCHAWGALPLYEFPANVLGVKPLKPGYKKVIIKPKALWINDCHGVVATCVGDIEIDIHISDGSFHLTVIAPKGADLKIIMPDGTVYNEIYDTVISKTCNLSNATKNK